MAKVGHIFTEGEITSEYPDLISAQLARIGEVDRIVHHISSPGGNVIAGYKGYHKLLEANKPIDTVVEGEAQSMGSFLMMASNATGGKIKVLNPSRVMIHNPKFNVQGLTQSGFADSDQLEGGANELRIIENEMATIYADSTCMRDKCKTIDEVKAMMKKETYMSADQAVQFGFADEVVTRINRDENQKLKAVALGLETGANKTMKKEKGILARLGEMLIAAETTPVPAAVDVPLKDGGVLNVDGNMQPGSAVKIDGQPADGEYVLEDGTTVKCVMGFIDSIVPAPEPAPAPAPAPAPMEDQATKMAAEIEQLKAQLAEKEKLAQEAATQKVAVEEEAKKLEAETKRAAEALVKLETEIKTIKKKTVGDAEKQPEGMEANRTAFAVGSANNDEKMKLYATRSFLADQMPWLERHYQGGKYSDGSRFSDYRTGGPQAVSILETNMNYTWNGVLSTELFFKPTIGSPALADIFTIDLGAKHNKRYHFAPTLNKVLKPYTGCDQAVTGTSADITSKNIQLKPFQMYESWCKDDFTNQLTGSFNVLAQEWLKSGNASFDPAGTPIDRMIVQLLKDGLRRDIFRRVSFGDTTSSNADWNQIDGLWQSLIDQSGASNYCVYRYGAALGTGTLSANTAQTYFEGIFNNSDNLLKQEAIDGGKGQFLVTRSVWENYYSTLAATGAVTEQAFGNQVGGIPKLTFRGIPVVPITLWDDQLTDSTNPLAATTKHLIAFTVKDNHILGVEDSGDLNSIDSWFEKKDNKRYYRANMTFGFLGALHCNLTTVSY